MTAAVRAGGTDGRLLRATQSAWSVLAGVLTAVGLIGALRLYTLLGLVLIYVGSAAFAMIMVYATFAESGVKAVRVVRIGMASALVLVVVLGLVDVFPVAGWFLALAAAVTSPLATDWLAARRRKRAPAPAVPARTVSRSRSPYQEMVDRKFEEIVADLEDERSRGNDGS